MNRQRTLLSIGLAVASASMSLSVLDVSQWVRAWFGLPVVALIPGYALVASMDPRGRLRTPERLALSIGASLSATIIVGLLVSVSPAGLHRESWAAGLGLFSILTSLLALHRTKGLRAVSARRESPSLAWRNVVVQSTIVLTMTATLAIALATAAATPIIGSEQAVEQGEASVLQLWVAPAGDASGEMSIGIDNPGNAGFACIVRVQHGPRPASERVLLVGPAQSVRLAVQRDPDASIMFPTEISLLDRDGSPLRHLEVWPPFRSRAAERDMKG